MTEITVEKLDLETKTQLLEEFKTTFSQSLNSSFSLNQIMNELFKDCIEEIKRGWKEKKRVIDLQEQKRLFITKIKQYLWSQLAEKKFTSTGAFLYRIPALTVDLIENYAPPRTFVEEAMKK